MEALRELAASLDVISRACEARALEHLAAARAELVEFLRFWPHRAAWHAGMRIFTLLSELERRIRGER